MIVRDEEKNISNCLGSVHGIFDEIVVVDTGSKDQTVEIARSFGARIFEFPWIDDFAAARNEALSHATGAYAFWLDADDVVEPTEREKLRALLATLERPAGACMGSGDLAVGHSGGVARAEPSAADAGVVLRAAKRGCEGNETFGQALGRGQEIRAQRGAGADRRSGPVGVPPSGGFLGSALIRKGPPEGGTPTGAACVVRCACDPSPDGTGGETVVDHIRLFPLRDDVRWTYRVHEQILPALRRANVPVRWTDLTVRHTGYVDQALRDSGFRIPGTP
jgi:glycosyltransferase involved in cell wall biosynthesis